MAWDGVGIEIRADAGFAVPEIYDYCEKEGIDYTIGLVSNPRLEAMAAPLLEQAKRESEESGGGKVRLLSDAFYRAESWEHARRVVYKAEMLAKGTNTRFVVTTKRGDPLSLYDFYVRRGESEGWIKDFKRALTNYLKRDRRCCRRYHSKMQATLIKPR